jgi:hypothetical protein
MDDYIVAGPRPNGACRSRRLSQARPRTYLAFADIEGKLDTLRVECTKCARKGRYSVRRLIEKYGRKGNMMKWKEQLNGDCPRRDAHSVLERCDLVCPDLPKVLIELPRIEFATTFNCALVKSRGNGGDEQIFGRIQQVRETRQGFFKV